MFPFAETFESLCLAGAVFYLRKERGTFWPGFLPFLAVTLAVELIGKYIGGFLHRPNTGLYNIYLIGDIGFVSWVLYRCYPGRRRWRPWFIGGFAGMAGIYFLELFLSHGKTYNSSTDSLSSFVFVFACGIYYFLLLRQDRYDDLLKMPAFWIVTGLFLFNFGTMVIDLFPEELLSLYLGRTVSLRSAIVVFLMAILYGCWIYAFRCKYQETISSLA